jgi:ribonuclease HII
MSRWKEFCRSRGFSVVAGLDEAGRGPLAGPVVAAAVIFPPSVSLECPVRDSKRMTLRQRERAYGLLCSRPDIMIGVGIVSQTEIDRINILEATRRAMILAVEKLPVRPEYLLIDGLLLPGVDIPQEKLIRGEDQSISIAAASIVAKVTRDRIMVDLDSLFPGYGFARHKGYGTTFHRLALARFGPSPLHRRSFRLRAPGF